jgi:hypothetical protein
LEANVHKPKSVKVAVLATKIEALERSITRIESQSLSRWDAVLVVVTVVLAVGAVVGLIGGLIRLF